MSEAKFTNGPWEYHIGLDYVQISCARPVDQENTQECRRIAAMLYAKGYRIDTKPQETKG